MAKRLHLRIRGRVQGVCYRAYASDQAQALNLAGMVRNRLDGSVELVAEGEDTALQRLLDWCWKGSPWARVEAIDSQWAESTGEYGSFTMRPTE